MRKNLFTFTYKLIIGIVVLMLCFILAIHAGAANITIQDIWLALTSHENNEAVNIIREIRLPREVGAIVVLMVSGIGAAKKGGFSPFRIVLAGAAVSAFLDAVAQGVALTFKISKSVSMWTAGGLLGTSWDQLEVIIPLVIVGIFVAILLSRQLTILSLNEDIAVGLGQKVAQVKVTLYVVIVLLAGASVALVGNLAFIGLMIPHMVRAIVGTDYRSIIPMSAVFGASFLPLADTLGRTLNAPYETPVATIIAVLGLPFFLFVVHKGGKAFS